MDVKNSLVKNDVICWTRKTIPLIVLASGMSVPIVAEEGYALEEVIVTAQKRAESVQDVPIAITAMSADFVADVGAQTVDDLGIYTPGLETRVTQPTQPSFTIRGITTNDFGIGADPAVAVYVDGVYSGRSGASLTAFQDIERVEVLKGPQGTLFGKNAAAGAIHLISKKPTQDLEMKVGISLGNYDKQKIEAMVNLPMTDNLALRLNVIDNQRDGYRDNLFNGDELADENSSGARASLLWQVSDDTQVLVQLDHSDVDQNAAIDSSLLYGDPYDDARLDVTPKESLELWGGAVTLETDLAGMGFTSISALKRFESRNLRDQDGSDFYTSTGGLVPLYFTSENVEENVFFSQEFRLSSQKNETYQWTLGAMYSREHGKQDSRAAFSTDIINAFIGINALPSNQLFAEQASGDLESTSAAVYADMTYALAEQWDLTLGLRYTHDNKDYELTSLYNAAGFGVLYPNEVEGLEQDDSWSNVSSRLVLDYTLAEDAMIYFSYATGYKAGGFNSTQPGKPFDEEQVGNLELGLKSTWFDSRLRFNVALFDYEYEDLQEYVQVNDPSSGVSRALIRNQDAEGEGIEMDLIWAASERLTLSANYSYLDTEVTDYELLESETEADNRKGERLVNVAKNSYNLGAEYRLPIGSHGELSVRADYSYVGRRDVAPITSSSPVAQTLVDQYVDDLTDPYYNLNARVTYEDRAGHWRLSLWGQNLTDEEYIYALDEGSATIGSPAAIRATPKFYGVDIEYRF